MRVVIALLLAVHGLIHLLGFLKPWKLAPVPQLSGRALVPLSEPAARGIGILWLLACVGLVVAGVLRFTRNDGWWMPAAVSILVSQALVVLQWHDAKAGTALNVILGVAVVVAGATTRFRQLAEAEARAQYAAVGGRTAEVVRPEELARLPRPVRRWLEGAGVVGRERAETVRLQQRGEMHTSNDAPWMPVEAVQYFTAAEPGFVWWMEARTMKLFPLCGRDKYVGGEGEMLIKVAGLVDVANDRGPKIDQGAMLRYLGEVIWFPSAALRPYITWEPVDDGHAKATMTHRGVTASAVFEFDDRGRVVGMSADRYFGATGGLERWGGRSSEWKVVRGVEIPVRGEVVWHLAQGDFTFFRWEILDVETNRAALYRETSAPGEPRTKTTVTQLAPR